MIGFAIGLVAGIGLGLWLYHYALGRAGWLGRLAARKAESKLRKLGKELVEGKPSNCVPPGRKSNLRYGNDRRKESL